MRHARPQTVMITGASTDVAKSFIVTGLFGAARRRCKAAALFTAINISNSARATPFGKVATSQFVQAVGACPSSPVLTAAAEIRRQFRGPSLRCALAARYHAWRTAALGVAFLDTDTGRRSRGPFLTT
jgi:hypothetical protein